MSELCKRSEGEAVDKQFEAIVDMSSNCPAAVQGGEPSIVLVGAAPPPRPASIEQVKLAEMQHDVLHSKTEPKEEVRYSLEFLLALRLAPKCAADRSNFQWGVSSEVLSQKEKERREKIKFFCKREEEFREEMRLQRQEHRRRSGAP